jgi:predicted enzyme related to lactoylglutathione lyase
MATRDSYKQGEFSWIELTTTDAAAAKRFYGGLFGWTFDDSPIGPDMTYTMVKVGTHHVGGLFQMGAQMKGMPSHWMSYVTVGNVDEITKTALASGGKVMKEPFDVMDAGRMAVVQDPTGATFAFWQPKKHPGAGMKNELGALCWNELYTTNADAAGKFYIDVLGWKTDNVDMGPMGTYTLFKVAGETSNVGGMMPMPPSMKGVPSNWLAYILVEDCDASTKKANELGGKTLMPPMDIPNIGRFSVVQDPTGAAIALYKNAH